MRLLAFIALAWLLCGVFAAVIESGPVLLGVLAQGPLALIKVWL